MKNHSLDFPPLNAAAPGDGRTPVRMWVLAEVSRCGAAWTACLLLWLARPVHAQEAVRMSIASAEAAAARRQAASTIGYYNLKVGPTGWKFGAGLGVEYNDNILNQQGNSEGDVIFRPQFNANMIWPISDKNSLNLALGAGYSAYVQHSELDRFFLTPGSELSFDLYAGDFWINFHDRFSINQDSYQDPTVVGSGNYARFENDLGAVALWDLNKVIVRFGYDHINYVSLNGNQGQSDRQSEVFSTSAGYALRPGSLVGVELGGGLLHYTSTNTSMSDAKQWNTGVFYETQVSQYMHFRGTVGYTVYTPDHPSSTTHEFTDFYAELGINHRVNQYVSYSLNGGRTINFGFSGGTIDLYYARLQASWQVLRNISLGSSLEYEHGSEISGGAETFDRYGLGMSVGRSITRKLSGGLGYQFYWRGSDVEGRDYTVDVVNLNLNYSF